MAWLDTVLQGVLLGGLYALFATGLSVIFGVMRLVNLAHGDFSILAAFLAVVFVQRLALNPLVGLVLVVPIMAALGWWLQRMRSFKGTKLPYTMGAVDVWLAMTAIDLAGFGQYVNARVLLDYVIAWIQQ